MYPCHSEDIHESNIRFASAISETLDMPDMAQEVRIRYNDTFNPVIAFNQQNIHQR